MGQILSQPITEKHSEEGQDSYLSYGLSCMQGWRISMEDSHSTILNLNADSASKDHVAFFGVYDGHGGEKVALYTGDKLHSIIKETKSYQAEKYDQALRDGFLACDKAITEDYEVKNDDSGCAATSVIITEKKIYCGNAGDSRTVLSSAGIAKALSYDHKPSNEGEKARICLAGGYVDIGRVNGNLALSRGIGDFEFKRNPNLPPEEQIVTAYPDVIEHAITSKDEFVILACDGIWDCLTSQQAVDIIRRGIKDRTPLKEICEIVIDICLAPTSGGSGIGCDNMSILIIALLNGRSLDQWYDDIINSTEGDISPPYRTVHHEIYKSELSYESNEAHGLSEEDNDVTLASVSNPSNINAFSLQRLLEDNAITNQDGVFYFDSSSASSLLAHLGAAGSLPEDGELDEDEDDEHEIQHEEDVTEHANSNSKIELIEDNADDEKTK